MALIYAKTPSDKALILDPRESLVYPFTAPDWTDLRLGMWVSATSAADNDSDPPTESVPYVGVADRIALGIKDGSDTPPATAGTVFLGILGNNAQLNLEQPYAFNSNVERIRDSANHLKLQFADGATITALSGPDDFWIPNSTGAADSAYGYCSGVFLRFVVKNRGLPGQTVSAYQCITGGSGLTPEAGYSSAPTAESIRTKLRTVGFAGGSDTAYAGDLPDAVYLHWPFFNSRLRIHTIVLEKFA